MVVKPPRERPSASPRGCVSDLVSFGSAPCADLGGGIELDGVDVDVLLRFLIGCREAVLPGRAGRNVYSIGDGRNTGYAPATINCRLAAVSALFAFGRCAIPRCATQCREAGRCAWRPAANAAACWAMWPSPRSLRDGFDLLGFRVQRRRNEGRTSGTSTRSSANARSVAEDEDPCQHAEGVATGPGRSPDRLGQIMHGWANYFRYTVAKNAFSTLDSFAWWRVIRILKRRHHWRWTDLHLQLTNPTGRWLPITAGTIELRRIAALPVTRYRYRGTTIPNPWARTPACSPRRSTRGRTGSLAARRWRCSPSRRAGCTGCPRRHSPRRSG